MQNVHFNPPELAKLFSVNVSTIKRWVDRGLLPAEKTAGGHRRISQTDLGLFVQRFPKYRKKSYVLKQLLDRHSRSPLEWRTFFGLLIKNNVRASEKYVEQMFLSNTPVVSTLENIIAPTLRRIGEGWANGEITVFDEHRMSFIVRQLLLRLDQLIPETKLKKPPLALISCVAGEHHEIPLLMLSLVFKSHGWKTMILGINTPSEELARAAKKYQAKFIAITKAYPQSASVDYLNYLAKFCQQNSITLGFGGGGWATNLTKKTWPREKCVRFYPSLISLDEYLKKK